MNKEKEMPIGNKVPINLRKIDPTQITASDLKKELNSIGLTCAHTNEKHLEQYIQEVRATFIPGKFQGFGTFQFSKHADKDKLVQLAKYGKGNELKREYIQPLNISNDWEMKDLVDPYSDKLAAIVYSENFDLLVKGYPGFTGSKRNTSYKDENTTVDAVKETFIQLSSSLAASLVEGLAPSTVESFMAHVIESIPEELDNYDIREERYMYLVKGYDESAGECDAVGAISAKYHIFIENYKDKKSNHQRCLIDIEMRSFVTSDPSYIDELIDFLENARVEEKNISLMPIKTEVIVFEELPPANSETFNKSLKLESKNNLLAAMVFYSPDIENIGMLDNTASEATSQYSKTITSGFTFTKSEKIGSTISCEIGCQFAKMGMSMNMEMSMTEQWNESQSETISFSVPAKKQAYLYQFYIHAVTLYYDLDRLEYYYGDSGRFLTNVVKTSEKSLIV